MVVFLLLPCCVTFKALKGPRDDDHDRHLGCLSGFQRDSLVHLRAWVLGR